MSKKVCYTFYMRRHVTRYIDHLHTKPEEERIQYALMGASVVTGIIFLVWLGFFFAKLSKPTLVIIPPAATESTQSQVDKILQDAQFGLGGEVSAESGQTSDLQTSDSLAPLVDRQTSDEESPTEQRTDPAADLRALFPRIQ